MIIDMENKYKKIIFEEFRNCVMDTIKRLGNTETKRPFHAALLSDEALFWSRFERSFSTSFGQRVVEEISKIVALAGGAAEAKRQKSTHVQIDKAKDNAINKHLNLIRSSRTVSWESAIDEINRSPVSGDYVNYHVISDLWWRKNGVNHYVSIKTVKPNIDQTAVAKADLLRLVTGDSSCNVYFGLYYNPYGELKSSYAHTPPMGIFDFHTDSVVLIGREYWDTLGGAGTYDEILSIAREVGKETRETTKDLYLK